VLRLTRPSDCITSIPAEASPTNLVPPKLMALMYPKKK
jgi:hypothetical protein